MAQILDFYFFYGSIHSYLSVMRRASRCVGNRSIFAKF